MRKTQILRTEGQRDAYFTSKKKKNLKYATGHYEPFTIEFQY